VDRIVAFGLESGFLQTGLRAFPDPRKNLEIPIDALLLPQILQRLNNEHSLLLAPYMLNSAELITKLGYNASVMNAGFNDRNVYPREAPFHGETLKHVLKETKADALIKWFNENWLSLWREHAPGRTHQYILDGMKIEVPAHLWKQYQGAGCVKNEDGTYSYGYKVVWLQEIIDRKGILVAMKIVPIQVNDLEAARSLVDEFSFEEGAALIADRGFIDGEWITHLKRDRKIDVFMPLKRNMQITQAAKATADNRNFWRPHPTREGQRIAEIRAESGDLFWEECTVLKMGVLAQWLRKDGVLDEVLFVTTKENQNGKSILATYDQRAEIEESHRQLKSCQGIETLPSKKLVHVVFRIIISTIGFNLMALFLNSENCETFEEFSLKTLRQRRAEETNPEIIIYTKNTFAVLRIMKFLPFVMRLKGKVKKKLIGLFDAIDLNPAPT
jgi:hypothetical protein